MKGVKHDAEISSSEGRPVVILCNDDDPHYTQTFESPDEVGELIAEIIEACQESFGELPTCEKYIISLQKDQNNAKR